MIQQLVHLCGTAALAFVMYLVADRVRQRFGGEPAARPWTVYGIGFALMITGVIVFGNTEVSAVPGARILIDGRGAVVALAAIYGGYRVGATTVLVGMVCRWAMGGTGPVVDLVGLAIDGAACLGLVWLWRRSRGGWTGEVLLLVACGLATGLSEALVFRLIQPPDLGQTIFVAVGWEVFLTQWLGTIGMGTLIHFQRTRGWYREMMEGALGTSIDGFAWLDDTGAFREANAALERMTGYAREELLAMNIRQLTAFPESDEFESRRGELLRERSLRAETRWRGKDGAIMDLAVSASLAPLAVGGVYVFFQDVTARKRAEAEARLHAERLRVALDAAEMLTWELDVATGVIAYSSNLPTMAGSADVAAYMTLESFLAQLHPEDRSRIEAAMRRTMERGEPFECDYRVRLPDGRLRWVIGKGKCVAGADGRPTRVFGAAVDVSERRRAEEAERREQQVIREIIDSIPGAFYILDASGRYVRWNAFLRDQVIGVSEETMKGYPALEPIHPEDRALLRSRIVSVLRDGVDDVAEGRVMLRGGPESRWYLFTGRRVMLDGAPHLIGTGVDISARKHAESGLREERERLSGILEGTHVGTWEWTVPTGELVLNERWAEITGYRLQELEPVTFETWRSLVHPEDRRLGEDRMQAHFRGEVPYYEAEVRMRHKDGRWIWVLDRGKVTRRTRDGKPLLMQGTHADVTARVASELRARALRDLGIALAGEYDQDAALRRCLETAVEVAGMDGGGLYLVDPETGEARLACHMGLGAEFVAKVERVSADSPQLRWARVGHAYHGSTVELGMPPTAPEVREGLRALSLLPICHEERLVAVLNVASHVVSEVAPPARDALETVVGLVVGVLQRLQALRSLEDARADLERRVEERTRQLARSEERYRVLFEALQDAILTIDETGHVVECNDVAVRMFGYADKAALRGLHLNALSPEKQSDGRDSRAAMQADIERIMADGRLGFEWDHLRRDGRVFPADVSVSVVWVDGKPLLQGVVRDISERKAAENELRASEARFRRLLEMAPMPLGLSNREGEITYLNARHQQTFGYMPEDIPTLDDWWRKAYPDAGYRQQVQARWFAAIESSRGGEVDLGTQAFRVTCRDGSVRDVLVTGVMLGNEFLAAFLDVTRLQEATESLRKLSQAVEYNPSMIFITDESGRVEYANPAWEQVTGYRLEEVRGEKPRVLNSGVHSREFYAALWGEISAGRVWRGEFCNRRKDGELYWEACAIAPVRDEQGVIRHFVAVKEDITARRAAAEELRQAKEAADLANQAKSRFLANMSHEIRTPMNAILGFARLLQRDPTLSPRQHHQLTVINQSGEHLLQLINDILDMSKIEAGRMQVTVVDCDFLGLASDLEQLYRQRTEERGIELEWHNDPDLPVRVRTDASKVRQVLLNLLGNAVKFTSVGSIRVRLSVVSRAATEGQPSLVRVRAEVSDTGEGIVPEELGQVFEAFEQTRTGRRQGGTGLGMAISRQIARMLGGDLTVTSTPGVGSRFSFDFAAEECLPAPVPAGSAVRTRRGFRLKPGAPSPSILIVDDIASNRDVLRSVLEEAGFQVLEAASGEEGIARCVADRPRLVLMDRRMPGLDGLEATRAIRGSAVGASTVVVILSAGVLDARETEWRGAGADGFLSKPFREDELLPLIGSWLGVELEEVPDVLPANRPPADPRIEAALPLELRREIAAATETGDIGRVRELIETRVAREHPAAAEALLEKAERFDYDGLRRLLVDKDEPSSI